MRGAIVAAIVCAVSAPAAATPAAALVHVQRSLPDVVSEIGAGMMARLQSWALPPPDLRVLTTEPVARTESSGFGWREDPIRKRQKFHHGTDYRGKSGTPILAAGDGTVIFAGHRGGYGKVVFVDHGGGIVTRYAHMRRIETKVGATVSAGEKIGQLGSTGRTTGPHLHFEVRLAGRSVDPNTALAVAELMRQAPGAGHLASFALAPELMANARDMHDSGNRRRLRAERAEHANRPERSNAPTRDRNLW